MDENKQEGKTINNPPADKHKKKVPRDVELRTELRKIEVETKAQVEQLREDYRKKLRDALFASTTEVGRISKERDTALNVARNVRDQAIKQAEKAREEALRKAQGDYDRAVNAAKKSFEETRDALEKQTTERTAPFREDHAKTEAALKHHLDEQLNLVVTTAHEKAKPLLDELDKIKAESAKNAKVSTLPDGPAKKGKAAATPAAG